MTNFGRLAALMVALALGGCRQHTQSNGAYQMTADQVLRDECSRAPEVHGVWNGALRVLGDVVWLDSDVFGIELRGQYARQLETFTADGSGANIPTPVGGQACEVSFVNVHLDGVTDSPTAFHGTFRIQYDTQVPDRCTCQMWATYRAVMK